MEDTDAGHNSTFCLMPTVYFSHKTLATIWAIQPLIRKTRSAWLCHGRSWASASFMCVICHKRKIFLLKN